MNSFKSESSSPMNAVDPLDYVRDRRRYYFDTRLNSTMVSVFQGDFYTSANPNETITTVLGSCIAVCIRDPDIRFGGMNHFLLPQALGKEAVSNQNQLRYGSYSIERLINVVMSHGGRRDRMEVKIFGGSNLQSGPISIGSHNADFVERYFETEGIQVVAKDLRGNSPRRLRYNPCSGKVLVKRASDRDAQSIFAQEKLMSSSKLNETQFGQVELYKKK